MNKIMLIGNVGQTPEVKQVGEYKVALFSIATTERNKGESKTEWHNCKAWNKLAEITEKYVKKGDKIFVEGSLSKRKYTAKDGFEKESVEVNVTQLEMLGGKQQVEAPVESVADIQNTPKPYTNKYQTETIQNDLPF